MNQEKHDTFIGLYQQHKDALINYLMHRLNGNREAAEDLFMDIILKCYEKIDEFDPEIASFKTWLFTIARNHLINFWRGYRTEASVEELSEAGYDLPDENARHPAQDIEAEIAKEQVQKVLLMLSDEERDMIHFRFMEAMDYPQIAEIVGKTEGAVRTALSRAVERFRQHCLRLYPIQSYDNE